MLIFKFINLLRGYAVIKIENSNYEKSLNLLRKNNVSVWDITKNEIGITFKISYDDYKKYFKLLKQTEMEAVKKSGAAVKLGKIIGRKGFIAGFILTAVCFFIFTSFIWKAEVVGTSEKSTKEILSILEKNGIKFPASTEDINEKEIESLIYNNFETFKFVEAYIEGTKLIIFVKENEQEEIEFEDKSPSSIVSTKNAVISKIVAKSGQPVVKAGDVVYEGQTLIMGIVKRKTSEDLTFVPSTGTVYGKTYYSFSFKEEKVKNLSVPSESKENAYFFQFNDKKYKIIGDTEPFKNYNYRERIYKIPAISDLLRIKIIKGTYFEEVFREVTIDESSAKNKMMIAMYDDLLKKCGNDSRVVNSSLNYTADESYYYLNAQLEVIEDIGKTVIIFPTENEDTNKEEIKED
jgi:similar to stage IV sporulation protein